MAGEKTPATALKSLNFIVESPGKQPGLFYFNPNYGLEN
jgi:hypothetical protein